MLGYSNRPRTNAELLPRDFFHELMAHLQFESRLRQPSSDGRVHAGVRLNLDRDDYLYPRLLKAIAAAKDVHVPGSLGAMLKEIETSLRESDAAVRSKGQPHPFGEVVVDPTPGSLWQRAWEVYQRLFGNTPDLVRDLKNPTILARWRRSPSP